MLMQAGLITLLGMGSVFFFLILLIFTLQILRICVSSRGDDLSKIAAAIAVAKNQE